MFKYCIAVLSILSIHVVAYGQLSGGAKAGINLNSLRGDESYDVIPGLNVGGYAKYKLTDFLSGRGELLYTQQGANLYDYRVLSSELYRTGSKVKFHSISLPLLLEFGLSSLTEDNLQPKLLVGGFYNYVFYARETYTNVAQVKGYDKISYEGSQDVSSLFEKAQYGFIGGIAADVVVFKRPVSFEFRYHYNVNGVNKPGTQRYYNLRGTHDKWGNDLKLATLSINVSVQLF